MKGVSNKHCLLTFSLSRILTDCCQTLFVLRLHHFALSQYSCYHCEEDCLPGYYGNQMFAAILTQQIVQGPVVQSNISLTSLLMVKILTVLEGTLSNSQVFLLKKM